MISIRKLNKSYNENAILKDVSLDILTGQVFGIIGKSGSGKSTLLRCINGLEKIDSGHILIDNVDIHSLNQKDLNFIRKNIGMVFQDYSLLYQATVFDNIALPMKIWKYERDYIQDRTNHLLKIIKLEEKANFYPRQLSGGQKQRVAIARALSLESSILLCDEPTSALDPDNEESILELLYQLNKNLDITIVIVSHQMNVIKSICSHFSLVKDNKVSAPVSTHKLNSKDIDIWNNYESKVF